MSRARGTPSQMNRGGKPAHRKDNRFKNASQTDVDWNNLNDKIEDWFEVAKTPEQRIVYKFLKEIKDEKYEDQSCIASVAGSLDENGQNVQSLEDILDNLKKYSQLCHHGNVVQRIYKENCLYLLQVQTQVHQKERRGLSSRQPSSAGQREPQFALHQV